MNIEALKELADENDTTKAIFRELSTRQRSRARIDLRKFKYDLLSNGHAIIDEEYVAAFKKLQDLGIGKIVSGRLGNATRFVWTQKLRKVAAAVRDPLPQKAEKKVIKKIAPEKVERAPIQITFNLSPDTRTEDLAALISLAKELGKK